MGAAEYRADHQQHEWHGRGRYQLCGRLEPGRIFIQHGGGRGGDRHGIDYTHPDLVSNLWHNPGGIPGDSYVGDYYGYDFADQVGDPIDSGYHGTHVSGTIAARGNNGVGVIGVGYQAKLMALKASADGQTFTDSAVIEAIQYATMVKNGGVNIAAINASFGGGGFSTTEQDAIQAAGDAGIVFCTAAGNNSANNDSTPTYPASYRLPNMIVVAASDQNDNLASFSNYGVGTVDLAAPGVNILSTIPTWLSSNTALVSRRAIPISATACPTRARPPALRRQFIIACLETRPISPRG